jgi:NAD(P)-dependent dehydrogenase (short-subunit alcohol dehydrogenase family)
MVRPQCKTSARLDTLYLFKMCQAIQATGCKNAERALVDLSRLASVSAFADTIICDSSQIDIVVYNAGVSWFDCSATSNGWEET